MVVTYNFIKNQFRETFLERISTKNLTASENLETRFPQSEWHFQKKGEWGFGDQWRERPGGRLVLVTGGAREAFTFLRVPSASSVTKPVIIPHHLLPAGEDLIRDWIGLMKTLSISQPQQFCRSHRLLYGQVKQKDIPCIGKRQAHPERLASEVREQALLSRARLIGKGKVLNSRPDPQPCVSSREK